MPEDPPDEFGFPCDPTLPDLPGGNGPKPTQAVAIVDLHGSRWVQYADERNSILRTVLFGDGTSEPLSTWSFNYDPNGQLTAVLHPDGARTCLQYDAAGNVARRLSIPATVPGLPTPAPISESPI